MEITLAEAYKGAKEALEDYEILRCFELEDSWIFEFTGKDPLICPPLQIKKSGDYVGFWYKGWREHSSLYGDWIRKHGKKFSVEQLEALIN